MREKKNLKQNLQTQTKESKARFTRRIRNVQGCERHPNGESVESSKATLKRGGSCMTTTSTAEERREQQKRERERSELSYALWQLRVAFLTFALKRSAYLL